MTNIFPPVLESQSPAIPYSGDETTNLELQFMMPDINELSAIKHVQVVIKYKETGRPAVNANYAPDGATLFIPTSLPQYWNCTDGKCVLKIPYKCFKDRKIEENMTYSIQVRFGVATIWGAPRDPFAKMSDDFSDFTVWRINQTSTLPSGFGEWSNITSVYCYGESLTSIQYNLNDFVPQIFFSYQPKYNDSIASCFIHYTYKDFSGTVTKSLLQSGQVQQDGTYSIDVKLNIAPVIPINVSLEATTVNNTLVGETITIPPITDIGGDLPLYEKAEGVFNPLNLLREEQEDGVLGKKLTATSKTDLPWSLASGESISIYRTNIFDFTTIRIADITTLSSMSEFSFKDYTPEMGEDYQYIAIIHTGFFSDARQFVKVYPWGFDNSGYDRLMKLDSIYFVDKHHQLKIEANANISTFKRNTSDTFQTTLGSKYPFYSRPSSINYRTFQFSGVVTINSDPTGTFFANDLENGLYWQDDNGENLIVLNRDLYSQLQTSKSRVRVGMNAMTNEQIIEYGLEGVDQIRGPSSIFDDYYAREAYSNLQNHLDDNVVYIERKFREKIMEWMSNGKPKLFRTETEGNMIVMLSAITFNPQAKTGRTIYSVSGTATEIADYSMENLIEYDLVPKDIKANVISSFPRQLSVGDKVSAENYNAIIFINSDLTSCFKKAEDDDGNQVDNYYVVKDTTNLQETLDSVTEYTFIRGEPQHPIYQGIYYKGNSEISVGDIKAGPKVEYDADVVLTDLTKAFSNAIDSFTALDPAAWPNRVILQPDGKVILQATSYPQEVGIMREKFYGVKATVGSEDFIFTFKMGNFYAPLRVDPRSIVGPDIADIKDTQQKVEINLNTSGGVQFPSSAGIVSTPYRYTPIKIPYGLEITSEGILKGRIAQATSGGEIEILIVDAIGNTLTWKTSYNQVRNWPVVTQLPQFIVDYPEVGQVCNINLSAGISGSGSYEFQVDTSAGEGLPAGLSLNTTTGEITGSFTTPKKESTTCYIKIRDTNLTIDPTVWHTSIQVQFGSVLPKLKFEGPDNITLSSGETLKGIILQGPSGMGPATGGGLIPIPLGYVLDATDLSPYVSGGLPFYSGADPYYKYSGFGLTPDYSVSSLGILKGMAQSGKDTRIAYARVRDMRGVEVDMPIKIAEIVSNLRYITDPVGQTPVELYIGEAIAGTGSPFISDPSRAYELKIPVTTAYLDGGFLKSGAGGYKFEIIDPDNIFNWLEVSPATTTGATSVTLRQKSGVARPVLPAEKTYVPIKISDDSAPSQSIVIQVALGPIVPKLGWSDGTDSKSLTLNITQVGVEASVNLPEITGGRPPYTVSAASIADAQGLLPFRVYQDENAEYDVTKYRIAGVPDNETVAPSAAMVLADSSGQRIPFVVGGAAPKLPLDYKVQNSNLNKEVVLIKGISQITTEDNIQIFIGADGNPPYSYAVNVNGMPAGYINKADPSLPGATGIQMGSDGIITGCPGESASILILGTDSARVTVSDSVTSRSYTDEVHQWKVPKIVDKIYPVFTSDYEAPPLNEGQAWSSPQLFTGGIGDSSHPNLIWSCDGLEIPADGVIMLDGVDSGLRWDKKNAALWSVGVSSILNNRQIVIRSIVFQSSTRFLTTDYIEQTVVKFQELVEILNWNTPEGKTDTAVYNIPVQHYDSAGTNLYSLDLNKVDGEFELVGGISPLNWRFSATNPPPAGWTLSTTSPGVLEYTIPGPEYGPTFTSPQFTVEVTDSSTPTPRTIKVKIKYNGAVDDIRFSSTVPWPSIPIMPIEDPPGTYNFEINLNTLFQGIVEGGSGNYGYQLVTNDTDQKEVPPYSAAFTPNGISNIPINVSGYSYPDRTALLYVWDYEIDPSRSKKISKTVNIGKILSNLTYPAIEGQLITIPEGYSKEENTFRIKKADYFLGGLGFSNLSLNNLPSYWTSHSGNIAPFYDSTTEEIEFKVTYPEVFNKDDCKESINAKTLMVTDPVFYNSIFCDVIFKSVYPEDISIYGVSWDGTADPKTSFKRIDDAANFDNPVPYAAGIDNYGSPFDEIYPWAGMKVVYDDQAGELVSIPKFYYKITQKGSGFDIQISNNPLEGFSVSPAHMARGTNHPEKDVVYIGRYHCAEYSYKSVKNELPQVSMKRSDFRDNISNLGENIYQSDFAMRFTIWLLYLVEYANFDSQQAIGYGCGNDNSIVKMGYTDSMPYHTGTMLSSKTTYGASIQYRNIEGLWDNVYDWIDGCYYDSNGLNIIFNPDQFDDFSGGILIGKPSNGYPSKLKINSINDFQIFYPIESLGSSLTYTCDYWQFNPLSSCLFGGGCYFQHRNRGLFCIYDEDNQEIGDNLGSRIMKL